MTGWQGFEPRDRCDWSCVVAISLFSPLAPLSSGPYNPQQLALTSGTRLGVYEVTAQIGVGGMGEVYRATDVTLGRQVAIKVLPEALASDTERIARFEREAKTLAALNHPNIAQIYGFEQSSDVHALVMELVEGPTLADRIAQGAIPVDETITIAGQIVEAIEAAHEQGIIHRDLKPANIKVREDGTVKVLDFGLAKLSEPGGLAAGDPRGVGIAAVTQSPTITTPAMTMAGVMLGTAAYMSPEQAKGRPADRRSDVWAFGAVLFEMLTGRRAFEGDDIADTLASVLRQEPDWTQLPGNLPIAIRTLIQRCLVKDRRRRVADIAVAQFVLTQQAELTPGTSGRVVARGSAPKRKLAIAAAVLLIAVAAGLVTWRLRPAASSAPLVRFALSLPDGQQFSELASQVVAMSPDGSTIVFVLNNQLYRRKIGEQDAQAIPGGYVDAQLNHPVFSPDGDSLLFFSAADGTLKQLPIGGGTPATIAAARNPFGMSWGEGGIVFDDRLNRIFRVPANGGTPQELVAVKASERVLGPQILPGGDAVLFSMRNVNDASWDTGQIVVQSLTSGERKTVIMGGTDGRYLPSGHLVYAVAGSLFAVGFDSTRQMKVGSAVRILTGVRRAFGTAMFSVSDTGSLVYVPGPAATTSSLRSLVQSDRNGVSVPLKVRPHNYVHPRVSRDGSTLAVGIEDGQEANVWIYELAGTSTMRKLTSEGRNRYPVWSGDGQRIAFQSDRQGDLAMFWQRADGAAGAIRLTTPPQGAAHVPESWSADGKHLLFTEQKDDTYVLFSLSVADMMSKPFNNVQSTQPTSAGFSPDGGWITYAAAAQVGGIRSPDRGIFIEPFPATGAKYPVPKTAIDFHPVWSSDGTEIMYVSAVAQPLVELSVRTQPSISFGSPNPVSPAVPRPGVTSTDVRGRGYDVLPGGKIVTLAPVATGTAVAAPRPEIRVVLNWQEELKRLVPTN